VKSRTPPITIALGLAALSQAQSPADVPANLQPPAGEKLILRAHASGWQIYTCGTDPDGKPKWTLKAPDAQLHDENGKVIAHHFAGPTWKSTDGSEVTGKALAHVDSPDPKSVPWLLLTATGHSGSGVLANVMFIQRLHTKGGQPPAATECEASKANTEARRSYTADYYFYAPAK
jgi:Protein of unknown function (DUF3455)